MRNFTIYLAASLCLFLSKATAQQTFEERAKAISEKIENITKEEKAALKIEVEEVNKQLESGSLTNTQADERKLKLAENRARSIENRVAAAQSELNQLVKDKVDGKIKEQDTTGRYSIAISAPITFKDKFKESARRDTLRGDSRTTSQFVFATGWNNVLTDGNISHSDYKFNQSAFYEWGLTWTTRILNKSNLLQAKYGLSLMYNNLRPTENRYHVADGDQTYLVEADVDLKHSRLRNVYISVPVHLEFDFGKPKDGHAFRKQQGFRFGIGGYGGARIKSKQVLRYEVDGDKVEERTKGDFNANDFIYGLSSYIGWEHMSLYVKYDLNPLFEDNVVEQNNISFGIRFDFN
ncbi:MAG TPA: hypothetical protein VGB50_05855 [Flavobacterium sp.]|jgi:hypothetical protein